MTEKKVIGIQIEDLKSLPATCGQRLKHLRKMTGLSRRAFAEKHELSPNTLQNWEDGKSGGLTEKGAKRVILALRDEGIQANTKWLLHGDGTKPFIFSDKIYDTAANKLLDETESIDSTTEELAIIAELQALRTFYQDTIDLVVKNDAMAPHFMPGDYVAGKKRYGEDIQSTCNLTCIVETATGDVYLRHVRKGLKPGYYTLLCSNLQSAVDELVFNNILLTSAAPVIWHRRKNS